MHGINSKNLFPENMLKNFCCCCSLQTGIVATATFNTFFCTSVLISLLYQVWDVEDAVMLYVLSAALAIYIAVNILLVYGADRKKPIFLVPFLILDGILIILTTLLFATGISIWLIYVFVGYSSYHSYYQYLHIFIFGVRIYLWVCVLSYLQLLNYINSQRLIERVASGLTEIVALPPPYDPPPPYEKLDF